MNERKIIRSYAKYLFTRILGFIFLYQMSTNCYVHSIFYRTMKDTLQQVMTAGRLKDDICVLKNPFHQDSTTNVHCLSCETLRNIKKVYDTSYSEIYSVYIKQNTPVIVIDAMFDWSILTDSFTIHNFSQVYHESRYRNIVPCELSSSIAWHSTNYLSDIFDAIFRTPYSSLFISWKNCDPISAKAIRNFYGQPYFMKYYIPAPKINSVVVYSNYESSSNYKEVKKFSVNGHKLLVLMQIRGSLQLELIPNECVTICNTIRTVLEESQILVLNSYFWQLKYSSPSQNTNIAILTESDTLHEY